jgi:hypothetical protein
LTTTYHKTADIARLSAAIDAANTAKTTAQTEFTAAVATTDRSRQFQATRKLATATDRVNELTRDLAAANRQPADPT